MYAPKNKNKLCSSSFFTVLTAYKNTSKRLRSLELNFVLLRNYLQQNVIARASTSISN